MQQPPVMPLYTTDAIILRTYKLGEVDRIVVFLTRDRGKRRGVAQGARRMRSRFGGALEPLTRVGLTYFEKESRDLVSLNYAEPISSPLMSIGSDALGYAGYFAELIDEWAQEADPNETLYRLGSAMVDALVAGASVEPLARYFEYWLLRLQGLYPSVLACATCGASLGRDEATAAVLMPGDHQYLCGGCARGRAGSFVALSAESLAFLRAAGTTSPGRIGAATVSERALRELEAVHRALIATHLEKEIKSMRVLREIRGH